MAEVLGEMYEHIGPVNVTFKRWDGDYFVPALGALWKFQGGYRFNGLSGDAIADWPDDWLVVGDRQAAPLILERSSGHVLFATHGQGSWSPTRTYRNVFAMLNGLGGLNPLNVPAFQRAVSMSR